MEAAEAIASKNPYLTQRAPKSVGRSQLPGQKLKAEYAASTQQVDDASREIEKTINDKIEEGRMADRLARTVAIPAKFQVNGALTDFGTFIYPGAGAIKYNAARTYLLAPNRTLVHVRDELPEGATPTLAGQYLVALVNACITFIDSREFDQGTVKIDGFTPSGRAFYWNVIGKSQASLQGYAGEIYHIDSGYARSKWKMEGTVTIHV